MDRSNLLWLSIVVLLYACCARGAGLGAETPTATSAVAFSPDGALLASGTQAVWQIGEVIDGE